MSPSVKLELFSFRRILTFVCSTLVALCAGTNYVRVYRCILAPFLIRTGDILKAYSAYSPQLGARLHISHTKLNIIGLAGNVGTYGSGPVLGRVVDLQGPRIPLGAAFALLLFGYLGTWKIYDAGDVPAGKSLPMITFCLLVVCGFMTGVGSHASFAGAVNSTAKSFPDRMRGTMNSIVFSGFGLSAFLFSAVAQAAFPGNTSSFLLSLAIGTSMPMIIGFIFIRPIPLPASELSREARYGEAITAGEASASAIFGRDDSHTALLAQSDTPETEGEYPMVGLENGFSVMPLRLPPTPEYLELDMTTNNVLTGQKSNTARSLKRAAELPNVEPNISGLKLWMSLEFWYLFVTMSLLAGTGLMYINNVGSISQALLAKANPQYDERIALRWQAAQVSTVSVANCLGRIFLGITADVVKNRFHRPRTYCLSLVSTLFLISQFACLAIDGVESLWRASALLGLAYGGIFGLFPILLIDYFGMPHFSENLGFLSLSPLLGGNIFSIAFGRNLDAHTPMHSNNTASVPSDTSPPSAQCLEGRRCYVSSLYITVLACFLALIISIWVGYRDRRKMLAQDMMTARGEVVWEEPDEE